VFGESDIPIFIAKEGIKLAHSRVLLFVAPCEVAVLKMYLLEVTNV
jgi:hypothetical protein